MAVQAGFVAGTLASAMTNLADVLNARVLLFLGALTGAASNAPSVQFETTSTSRSMSEARKILPYPQRLAFPSESDAR